MEAPVATIRFLRDWRHEQQGAIERGGQLVLEYDKGRSPECFTMWRGAEFGDIVAWIRFQPRGELFSGSVVAPVRSGENPPGPVIGHVPVPLRLSVPSDATQAEIWFHSFYQTSSRCDAWDSQFGQNYWFAIGGAPPKIPQQSVAYRTGSVTRPDMVNVLEQSVTKVNAFPPPPGGGSPQGLDLQTSLKVVAWVPETTFGANAWIDVHVFDDKDGLIRADTLTLHYTGFGGDFRYEFSGKIYQGSTATPGSVQPRPEARKVQYRLYYEIQFQVFTDDILHQHELQEDAVTH
jgi:Family of unknown function (DUF6209)